jgi:hypothetical protein
MQAYVACLKQHGVDLPANGRLFGNRNGQGGQGEGASSPPSSFQLGSPPQTQSGNSGAPPSPPPSIDRAKLQAARDACADLLPEGATFGGGFGGGAGGADSSAFNAYRSCMSDHGVTIPGGQNGGGQTGGPPASIDRNTDAFKSANAVCAPLLPNGGQGFGGGQGNPGGQTGQGSSTQGTTP